MATPCALATSSPVELTEATPEADEDHVTYGVIFIGGPVGQEPVAVSCCCWASGIDGLAGVTVMEAIFVSDPVPDSATVCGLELAVSVMVRAPVNVPIAVGVKVTEILQLAPMARVFGVSGQVEVCAKLLDAEIPEIVNTLLEEFRSVTLLTALVVVGIWAENVTLVGVKVTGVRPDPLSEAN